MRRALVVVAVLCVAIWAWWAASGDVKSEEATVAAPTGTRLAVPRPAGRPARASAARSAPAAPAMAPAAAPIPAKGEADEAPADGAPGPVDRRADAPPDADAVRELLMQELQAVTDAAGPCADQWAAVEPNLDDKLVLRFALDADGLQDVWIEGHTSAPDAVLACFSDAVWAPDWAGISREPLEVSWPVQVRGE